MDKLDNNPNKSGKVLTEEEMKIRENQDDADLFSSKAKLESLKKQKPPTDPNEMVKYLLLRLEAAEDSIVASEKVIGSERDMRTTASKQLKEEINDLQVAV
mmetsp:Transcript_34669/g.53101  ORF Transcript_34669/g.53101 Transcript_34669/m.53101 type:complete len:101 (+) Transcript_34669:548-850(+)